MYSSIKVVATRVDLWTGAKILRTSVTSTDVTKKGIVMATSVHTSKSPKFLMVSDQFIPTCKQL
jgi:hypothetical protein